MKINMDRIALIFFVLSISFFSFSYGVFISRYRIFPYFEIKEAFKMIQDLTKGQYQLEKKWWYIQLTEPDIASNKYNPTLAYDGLNLVAAITSKDYFTISIINMEGRKVYEWKVDWFDIWPDSTHLPEEIRPRSRPGTTVHGMALLENGDLLFNYERLGLVKLDICGRVIWRLPYFTHHSVYIDENSHIWVSAQKYHKKYVYKLPGYEPPFIEPMILEITQEGKIIREISVFDLLLENGKRSLLFLRLLNTLDKQAIEKRKGEISSRDTLHLNDVEIFPSNKEEGFFKKGDILVSLRNINTILVFDPVTRKIKFLTMDGFVWQHDPDFIDGNTISVFDNNTTYRLLDSINYSRIIILSVLNNKSQIFYSGHKEQPFYTKIMGKHQWLPNGNLLISEATKGRAFEVTEEGEIVWQYFNKVKEDVLGIMTEVQRLSPEYQTLFNPSFLSKNCGY